MALVFEQFKKPSSINNFVKTRMQTLNKMSKSIEFDAELKKYMERVILDSSYEPEFNIDEYVDYFSKLLIADKIAMENGENVSDAGMFAPRCGGSNSVKKNLTKRIAYTVFPPHHDTDESRLKSLITYQHVISKLRHKYVAQLSNDETFYTPKENFKKARYNEHHGLWCTLKEKRGISAHVMEPTAMPVEIAPYEELEPFIQYLASDCIDPTIFGGTRIDDEKCYRFKRGAVYDDGRMDLCKQVVGPTWIESLMESLKHNTHIEHFLLGNNIINERGANAIKRFLLEEHSPKIKTWYLAGNDIDAKGLSDIVDGLQNDKEVTQLWLKRNPLKSDGMAHIRRLLLSNNTIKVLDLQNTGIMDGGIKDLVDGLMGNRSLRHLYMDANGITKESVKYLVDYFKHLVANDIKGITSLWISMNRLDDDGIINLVEVLGEYKYIKRLNIGSNMLTGASMEFVYRAFKNHPALTVLDLGMYKSTADMGEITNRISDIGAFWVAKLISENTVIKYLSCLHNGISESGVKDLIDAYETNKTILYFAITQYGLVIDQELTNRHKSIQDRNASILTAEAVAKDHSRILRHSKKIYAIDSIYRNSAK
jgi:Ran GTPase-activating protein (RanGAP) involved in mRNA processing and transport